MSLFTLLKTEHREVERLLGQIQTMLKAGREDREVIDTFREMSEKLFAHAKAEESVVYSQLRERDETKKFAYEALEEHQIVVNLLAKLQASDVVTDQWRGRFKILMEAVVHHVEEEESTAFPLMRKAFSREELEKMAEDMEIAEVSVKEGALSPAMFSDWSQETQTPPSLQH